MELTIFLLKNPNLSHLKNIGEYFLITVYNVENCTATLHKHMLVVIEQNYILQLSILKCNIF